jgi:hypothetical protein
VRIEPLDARARAFGSAARRVPTAFPAFLDLLEQEDECGRWYLTTQYDSDADTDDASGADDARRASGRAEEDEDGGEVPEPELDPICPPPTDAFAPDFPLAPPLMGHLVLQQCNLWSVALFLLLATL